MSGWFNIPQNPIRDAGTPLVASASAMAPNKVLRTRSIGELLQASFTVPQNPIIRTLATGGQTSGMVGLGCSGLGCLGDTTSTTGLFGGTVTDTGNVLTSDSLGFGIPNWGYIAGGGLLAWMLFMPGGSEYRSKKRALAAQYTGIARAKKAVRSAVNPRRKNIAAGYYDEDGYFHPIRASFDYSPSRAGEGRKKRK